MLQQLGSCVKFRGKIYRFRRNYQWGKMSKKYRYSRKSNVKPKYPGNALKSAFPGYSLQNLYGIKNGSKEARTPDLSRVRRTLIPAELCFQKLPTNIILSQLSNMSSSNEKIFFQVTARLCILCL